MYKNIIERIIYLRYRPKEDKVRIKKNSVNKKRGRIRVGSVSGATHDNKCIFYFKLREGQP